jgi:plasmid stabilization system protein ParE
VLAARGRAVRQQLEHSRAMRDLAALGGERWGVIATEELIRRLERELAWLAELGQLAAQDEPEAGTAP